jgi:CheY-like chemotaxis protein
MTTVSGRPPAMSDDLEVLFRGLPDEDSRAFLALGVSVPFEAGQVILPAGRSDWDIYVIEAGELSVWVGNALIGTLKRGQTIDTSSILFPQIQWSAVRSDTAGRLLKIQREAVMGFFESRAQRVFHQFCVNLFKVWVEVLRDRNARIADIQGELLYAPKPGAKERYSILVVDDEAMAEFFGERYDVITAPDGAGAIESALTQRPDLILLDLRMPNVDGYEVCKRLKTHPETGYIPIIMLTALDATPDKVKGMMYGADEYLTKPVDLVFLDETVSRVLAKVYE